jgi:branched-chain amino acid transport system permease protein
VATRLTRPNLLSRQGRWGTATLALVLAALAGLGQVLGSYDTGLFTTAFLFAIAATSLDLVWGFVGAPDLGHAMWFGIGALTVGAMTAVTDRTGLVISVHDAPWRYAVAVPLGMAIAAALAGLVAKFSFSAKGSPFYIAIVTLALSTVVTTLYSQFPRITGGDNGLFGFAISGVPARTWYYLTLAALALVVTGALILVRSDAGLLLRAVRDNGSRARYLGANVERVKIVTFMLGAALAAFAGGLYGLMAGLVSADLFSFLFATEMLVWVSVGGRGTIIGPVLGAIGLHLAGARLSEDFPTQWALIEGLLFVVVVVFLPDGVLPTASAWLSRLVRRATPIAGLVTRSERRLTAHTGGRPDLPTGTPVVTCSGVHFGYRSLLVLRGVELRVERGELLCIVGPNGAGKTTLLSVLADGGLPITGEIHFNLGSGGHGRRAPHRLARAGVSRKFQAPHLFGTLSVAETLLLARANGRLPSLWRRSRSVAVGPSVLDVVEATGLAGRDNDLGGTLAHGLKQGLELAAAVASRPQVLLLDEPTAGLTTAEREVIGSVLRRLVGAGMTVVLIEHDLDFVYQVADRVAVLHEGRIIEQGTPAEVANSTVVRQAYLGAVVP